MSARRIGRGYRSAVGRHRGPSLRRVPSTETAPGLERTLERIALGARVAGGLWMGSLAVIAIVEHGNEAVLGWVLGPALLALVWPGAAAAIGPERAMARTVVDASVGAVALLSPLLAEIPDVLFYGGVPLIVVAVSAVTGRAHAWAAGFVLSIAVLARVGAGSVGDVIGAADQLLTYLAGVVLFTWTAGVIRRGDRARRAAERERVRAETRADVSRHLHDSVLQTLALIQREAERPDEVRTLARSQERELREWLFAGSPSGSGFASSLRAAAADVEARYRAPVEVVVVGDHGPSPEIEDLVAAATEAMVNAVRHARSVTVYGESDASGVRVFVRDRGQGFDPAAVPDDRHGIRDSIAARMEEAGGRAELRTRPGGPTEWRLEVPR